MSKEEISQSATTHPDIPEYEDFPTKTSFARSQYLLQSTIDNVFLHYPVSNAITVTMTFSDQVMDPAEAHRRLNSFMNKIRERKLSYIWVLGSQRNGRLHYHLLVPVDFDCYAGTDLEAWSNPSKENTRAKDREQRNAMNPALRAEADFWQKKARYHEFGRVRVEPIYSNAEAMRNYLVGQAPKSAQYLQCDTRSIRFWSCSKSLRVGTQKFAWATKGGRLNRARLREWAHMQGIEAYDDLPKQLGPMWGWFYRQWLNRQEALSA